MLWLHSAKSGPKAQKREKGGTTILQLRQSNSNIYYYLLLLLVAFIAENEPQEPICAFIVQTNGSHESSQFSRTIAPIAEFLSPSTYGQSRGTWSALRPQMPFLSWANGSGRLCPRRRECSSPASPICPSVPHHDKTCNRRRAALCASDT